MQKKTSRKTSLSATSEGISALRDAPRNVRRKSRGRPAAEPFTAEELRKISEEISLREFPVPASNRLVLMEIDPWNVHAYWHIQASEMAKHRTRLKRKGLNPKLVLRFHDVSSRQDQNGVHERFDIEVTEDSRNWYVNLWRDGKHYSAEIGLRADDGSFMSLATSNQITTPRAYPSSDLDFYMVNARTPATPDRAASSIARASNDDLLRNLFPQRFSSGGDFPWIDPDKFVSASDEGAFPALEEAEPEQVEEPVETPSGFPLLDHRELEKYGTLTSKSREKFMAESQLPAMAVPPTGMVAPAGIQFDSRPSAIPMARLSAEGTLPFKAEPGNDLAEYPSKPEICKIREGNPVHRFVALEMYLGSSDASSSNAEDGYKIEANLIVEGKCPAGTHLLFFGEKVHVEPDGTFRIKQPLERGPELLEFMYRVSSRKNRE